MHKCPNEERVAKKSDLKKMREQLQKQDRKEDDKRYAKKSERKKK